MSTFALAPPGGHDDPGRVFERFLNRLIFNKLCKLGLILDGNTAFRHAIFSRVRDFVAALYKDGKGLSPSELGEVIRDKTGRRENGSYALLAVLIDSVIDQIAEERGILVVGPRTRRRRSKEEDRRPDAVVPQVENLNSIPSRHRDHVEEFVVADEARWYENIIDELPADQREALRQHVNGATVRKIGEALGIPRSTANARLALAKAAVIAKVEARRGY